MKLGLLMRIELFPSDCVPGCCAEVYEVPERSGSVKVVLLSPSSDTLQPIDDVEMEWSRLGHYLADRRDW